MDRGATPAIVAELGKSQNQPFHLVEVLFDTVPAYMTDAWTTIVWDGKTYLALGNFIGFSDIEESSDLQVAGITVQLSGVNQTMISAVLAENYIDRQVIIRKGFFDANMAVIADPVIIFDGRMDSPVIEENPDEGTCTVGITATNAWVDFERKSGRHTNHEEQQIFFPGDLGFQYSSEVVTDIVWGRK